MAIKAIGSLSGTVADVDGDRNQRVVCRNPGIGTYGSFSAVFATGAIAATSSTNAVHWEMWNPDHSRIILIEEVTVSAWVVSTITTAVAYFLTLRQAVLMVAPDISNGSQWANTLQTRRSSMSQSVVKIITNNTTAAGITGGTAGSVNRNTLGRVDGNSGTVTGTQFFNQVNTTLFSCKRMWGSYPLILDFQDVLQIVQGATGPATGTYSIVVRVKWSEIPSGYPLIPSVANSTQLGSLANF